MWRRRKRHRKLQVLRVPSDSQKKEEKQIRSKSHQENGTRNCREKIPSFKIKYKHLSEDSHNIITKLGHYSLDLGQDLFEGVENT